MVYGSCLLFGMLGLSFINASIFSRIVFIFSVPANFLAKYFEFYGLDFMTFSSVLFTILIGKKTSELKKKKLKFFIYFSGNFIIKQIPKSYLRNILKRTTVNTNNVQKNPIPKMNLKTGPDEIDYISRLRRRQEFLNLTVGDIKQRSMTPSTFDDGSDGRKSATPFSSTLINRHRCTALTVKGDGCRNAALADSDLCRVHCRNYD